jgi:hypothetical protein
LSIFSVNAQDIKDTVFTDKIWPLFKNNYQQKVIIFTHYNTISSGINLQRPAHEYECVFDENINIDIDFLYLDLPTDLLTPSFIYENQKQSSLISVIFHIQSLYYKKQLSDDDYHKALGSLMKNVNQGSLLYLNKLYKQTKDYQYSLMKIIEQSIGRMSRTLNKHTTTQIMLSSVLNSILVKKEFSRSHFDNSSFEVQKVIDYIENNQNDDLCDSTN